MGRNPSARAFRPPGVGGKVVAGSCSGGTCRTGRIPIDSLSHPAFGGTPGQGSLLMGRLYDVTIGKASKKAAFFPHCPTSAFSPFVVAGFVQIRPPALGSDGLVSEA